MVCDPPPAADSVQRTPEQLPLLHPAPGQCTGQRNSTQSAPAAGGPRMFRTLTSRFLAPDPVPEHTRQRGEALRAALRTELSRSPGGTPARSPVRVASPAFSDAEGREYHPRRDARIAAPFSPFTTSLRNFRSPPRRPTMMGCDTQPRPLLVDHRFNVMHLGIRFRSRFGDSYHNLLDLSWWKLLVGGLIVWISLIVLFAGLLRITCGSGVTVVRRAIDGVEDICSLELLVWFSVHTFSTTGYGELAPTGSGQLLAAAEMWAGLVYGCVAGAIAFHKLARPSRLRESLMFSEKAVINRDTLFFRYSHRDHVHKDPCLYCAERGEYDSGEPCLMFRVAHTHRRQHLQVNFHLYLYQEFPGHPQDAPALDVSNEEDARALLHLEPINYSFTELNFECTLQYGRARSLGASSPMPCLPFLVVHHLDEHSPLRDATSESLHESKAELVAVYDAIDEGCGDVVQCRHAWRAEDVLWDRRFVDMVFRDRSTGKIVADFTRLDQTVHCPPRQGAAGRQTPPSGSPQPPPLSSPVAEKQQTPRAEAVLAQLGKFKAVPRRTQRSSSPSTRKLRHTDSVRTQPMFSDLGSQPSPTSP
eukprot:TRINITY_DN31734_c0_g1_i1.p1 TRINITY_DN31734_c0_g1~~TRINITY_DN31734_c0_g1_i1.p1  ORF type:complete len:588 (+),score=86.01 TRINITY_DN31734_c0_g1_i1:112-1875(+)